MTVVLPYIVALAIAAGLSFGLAIFAVRTRPKGGRSFALLEFGAGIWAASHAIQLLSPQVSGKLLAIDFVYSGVGMAVLGWTLFAIVQSGSEDWLTPARVAAISVPMVLLVAGVWTNPLHHQFYLTAGLNPAAPFPQFLSDNGPAYWALIVYSYSLMVVGFVIRIRSIILSARLYRGDIAILVLGALVPFIGSVLHVTRLSPLKYADITPFGFNVSGLLFAIVVLRGTLFNVIPIARTMIIESMDDAVVVLDTDNLVVDLNPAAADLIGQPAGQVLGKPVADVFTAQRDVVEAFADAKEERAEITVGEGADRRYYDLQISTVYRRLGHELGRLVVLRDITRRKEAEVERERLIGDLNAYARTVAHDLKNPLGLITGYVDFIEMKYKNDLPDGLQDRLDIIQRTGVKMNRIVDELLTLASIRRNDAIETKPVDTQEAVEGALARLEHVLNETKGEVVKPDRWPTALGHSPWVEEIWANYISNALKYGGEPPRIELGADPQSDGRVRFWVRDNGKGLTPAEQEKLFAEFARLDQHIRIEGSGLGLSIVARIAQKLGGDVGLESTAGKGSTFWFTLPAAKEPANAA